ncbi:fructosamine kinase family protein [Haloferula chungangensis]|uniref:Fructosamine kinase family protein n=1 Tax=Haloferula chungangensis TaxID=1048331 RepID=A0ABW2L8Y6_9BACT
MQIPSELKSIVANLPSAPDSCPVPLGGGCIHRAWKWGPYFIKTNSVSYERVFQAEADCLAALRLTGSIRVPELISRGQTQDSAYLVLEYLDLQPTGNEARLGEQLAALHHHQHTDFGFPSDNFIGASPQSNQHTRSWTDFFRDQRILPILSALEAKGISFQRADRFLERLAELLPQSPKASLLHGDLWSGNRAFLKQGTPVIFDPACYFGHAACDLAMTRLFGGFGPQFYHAYRSHSAFDDPSLDEIYNLYHLLNHALLFGGSYISQAGDIIRRFS